jgi:hypothetical protein
MPEPLSDLMSFLAGAFRREAPIHGDASIAGPCAARVAGNDRLSPAEQADIYRRQFWLRHLDSLREDYPGLMRVLGDDAFDAFCTAYLTACPPRSPSMRDLGADIVAFAERYPAFPGELRAPALEMVRYENSFVDLFDGEEPPPLEARVLQEMAPEAWETARIKVHPLLVRHRFTFPVHRIRLAAKNGEEAAVEPSPSPIHLAIYRGKDLRILFEELEPLAFELLSALAGGEALVPACGRIAEGAGEAEGSELQAKVGAWFQQWAAAGWIVGVETDPQSGAPASADG